MDVAPGLVRSPATKPTEMYYIFRPKLNLIEHYSFVRSVRFCALFCL